MTQVEENKEKAIAYLLGELDETERDQTEESIFSDDEFALFLSAVEKDLIDDYARGEMDPALRQRFERNYLISEGRREKARVAQILQKEVFAAEKEISAPTAAAAEAKSSFWTALTEFFRVPNLALAGGLAVVLLFVLVGGWILLRRAPNAPEIVKDKNENRPIEIPTPSVSPENSPEVKNSNIANKPENDSNPAKETENNVNRSPENRTPEKKTPGTSDEKRETAPPAPRIFVATLLPLTRGDEKPVLTVPKNAETVKLRVVHDNLQSFVKYRAELRDQNGALVFTREFPVNEKTIARPVTLTLKATTLAAGAYELTLSGVGSAGGAEEIKFYNFTVRKK